MVYSQTAHLSSQPLIFHLRKCFKSFESRSLGAAGGKGLNVRSELRFHSEKYLLASRRNPAHNEGSDLVRSSRTSEFRKPNGRSNERMGQVLTALHRLQAVELQLAEIRREHEAKARRVAYYQRLVHEAEEKLAKQRTAVQQRQVRLDVLQLDVTSREESINKHRQALNRAKTNKDYAAILTAMNTEKADVAKIETEVLQLMEEIQTLKDEAVNFEEERAKVMENVARAEASLREFDAKVQPQRIDLDAQRDECAQHLEPTTLAAFTRVAEHHDGQAMVSIARLHPKRDEYVCLGCNLKITLEVVNALQTRDDIQICKACGRILYLEN